MYFLKIKTTLEIYPLFRTKKKPSSMILTRYRGISAKRRVNHGRTDKKGHRRQEQHRLSRLAGTWKLLPQCLCISVARHWCEWVGACVRVCVCEGALFKCFFVSRCVCEGAKFQKQPRKSFFAANGLFCTNGTRRGQQRQQHPLRPLKV